MHSTTDCRKCANVVDATSSEGFLVAAVVCCKIERYVMCFSQGEDMREGSSPSWFNPQEAVLVMKYLQSVVNNGFYTLTFDDIGIITPYRKQVNSALILSGY